VGHGHVGVLTVDLHLPEGASLKTKRKELLRVKSALARRHSCAVAEVDHHDLWQRARLTLALVSRTHGEAQERLEAASRALYGDEVFQVLDLNSEVVAVSPDGLEGR
jgi:uncharacterized protein YlxP (DUF503 family)